MINRERLVQTFCDLVRIDSPSGQEEGMAKEMGRRLVRLGFTVVRDGHGNLVASEPGPPQLLLSGHMDTVEPGRGIQPRVAGDRVTSDGTTILGGDCKAGLAAILEALESMAEERAARRRVQVVLTRQEEIGLVGAKNVDFSLIGAREGIIFDGEGPVSKVTTGSPTYIAFDVQVRGRAAHAGVEPEKGLSAIRIAAEIIAGLPQGRLDSETTLNVATIQGGTVRNAVPEEAAFAGEFRSRNPATLERVRGQLTAALEAARRRHPEATVREELTTEFEMYSLPSSDPLLARVVGSLSRLGLEPQPAPSGGGTDANVFNRHDIRCVVVGIATREPHTVREHVSIPDLVDVARFCQAFLTSPVA